MTTHRDPRVALVAAEVLRRLRETEREEPGRAGRGAVRSVAPAADADLASLIDHTLLRPEASRSDIERLVAEAREHRFAAVCINPVWVPLAARALAGTRVKVATVVGFPLGAMHTAVKALEARRVRELGADEIDMVVNQGELAAGRLDRVRDDVAAVRRAIGRDATLKVILETARLSADTLRSGARAALEAGADYLKTSTGFGPGGATVEAVRLLRDVAGTRAGVKASGGIRTLEDARAMIAAGASRLGTSAGVALVTPRRDP